jgi:NAD(P)H-flavin reductase
VAVPQQDDVVATNHAAAAVLDDPMLPRPFQVTDVRRDTADTMTLWLEPRDGRPLVFGPGQFTMLHAFGVGEVPISISGDPADPSVLQHTIRDVGGVTSTLVRTQVGEVLGVRGPYGVGWEARDGAGGDVLVVAGGIGLAPLRPALLDLVSDRGLYRRVVLLYGARSPDDLLYPAELARWAERSDVEVMVTVDQAPAGYAGRVGLVTDPLARAGLDPAVTLALVCGPEVMMRHVAQDLVDIGVAPSRVRLSLERNMRCGVGLCGHCQLRELFLCVDGPVLSLDRAAPLTSVREL